MKEAHAINSSVDKPGWFLTHWRGEASLGIAYWINGLLLGYLLPGMITFGLTLLAPLRHYPRLDEVFALSLTVVGFALWVWVVVGIVRSANRHVERGGKLVWANLARVLMALSVIGMAISLHTRIIPNIRLMSSLLAGHDPFGVVDVGVSADGLTITVDGQIGQGSVQRLQSALEASPKATEVTLNSNGGRLAEAEDMAALIQARHLNTAVQNHCESACTLIFLGGAARELPDASKLGFHLFSNQNKTDLEQQATLRQMKEAYRAFGIREWFIDHIAATPADSMWYPTKDELKEAAVLK